MAKISSIKVDSKIPEGPLAEKWTNYKAHQKLVNPANKRKLDIIVVGTGLAGASAAASLACHAVRRAETLVISVIRSVRCCSSLAICCASKICLSAILQTSLRF